MLIMSRIFCGSRIPRPTAPPEPRTTAPEPEAVNRTVLVFSPRPGARQLLADDVRKRGMQVCETDSPDAMLFHLSRQEFCCCIIDDADSVSRIQEVNAAIRALTHEHRRCCAL